MDNEIDLPEDLIDIDHQVFLKEYAFIVDEMKNKSSWYRLIGTYKGSMNIDFSNYYFEKIEADKILCLGRSDYYDNFMLKLSQQNGADVFQSDYMVWIDPSDPYISLLFYIETAKEINFNLQGISNDDIQNVLKYNKIATSRLELGIPYMTSWEMNQILFSDYLRKTIWHTPLGSNIDMLKNIFQTHSFRFNSIKETESNRFFLNHS
jgi:hypothetical protein